MSLRSALFIPISLRSVSIKPGVSPAWVKPPREDSLHQHKYLRNVRWTEFKGRFCLELQSLASKKTCYSLKGGDRDKVDISVFGRYDEYVVAVLS